MEDEGTKDILDSLLDEVLDDDDECSLLHEESSSHVPPTTMSASESLPPTISTCDPPPAVDPSPSKEEPRRQFLPESQIPTPKRRSKADESPSPREQSTVFRFGSAETRHYQRPASRRVHSEEIPMAQSLDVLRKGLRSPSRIPSPKFHSPSKLTVPQAPRLHPSRVNKQEINQEDPYSMAQAEEVLKKGLRSPSSPESMSHIQSTVPHAPHLHQSKINKQDICQEDPFSMAQAEEVLKKGLRSSPDSSATKIKRSPTGLTVPQAPKFHQTHRGRNGDEQPKEAPVFMAQSLDVLKKGLRHSEPVATSPSSPTRTIPRAPVFHAIHDRPLPKSHEELEIEIMKQSTPFKATPMPQFSSTLHALESPPRLKPSTTKPEPFHFHSDERAAHHKKPEPSVDKEALDLEECKKKFKARPMPEEFKRQREAVDDTTSDASLTKSITSQREKDSEHWSFKARPLPKSTYASPEQQHSNASGQNTRIDTADLEATLQETDRQFLIDEQQACLDTEKTVLSSDSKQRLEEYKRRKEEKRRQEHEEAKRLREFHARPLPKSIQLQIQQRSETEKKRLREQPMEETSYQFRARPLPKSIALQSRLRRMNGKSSIGYASPRSIVARARPLPTSKLPSSQPIQRNVNSAEDEEPKKRHRLMEELQPPTSPAVSSARQTETLHEKDDESHKISLQQAHESRISSLSTSHPHSTPQQMERVLSKEKNSLNQEDETHKTSSQQDEKETSSEHLTSRRLQDDDSQISKPPLSPDEYYQKREEVESIMELTKRFAEMEKLKVETTKSLRVGSLPGTKNPVGNLESEPSYDSAQAVPRHHALATVREPTGDDEYNCLSANSVRLFLLLCVLRILNTFFIQSYFEADEFWQTLEPAYCAAFLPGEACSGFTWEWKRRSALEVASFGGFIMHSMLGPVRSYLSVLPAYFLYRVASILRIDTAWLVARGPMILNAITVAAPTDWCVWYAARWLGRNDKKGHFSTWPQWSLFCSVTSWFNAYALVRAFSNAQETVLLAVAVALVSPEFIGNEVHRHAVKRACLAFFIGGLSTSIRFTAITVFVPMGIILAERRSTLLQQLLFIFCPCALFGLLGIIAAALVDRLFYGFWTIPFLGNIHFNVISGNAALYGTHPWFWYITVGLPAVTGLLFPLLLGDFCGRGSSSYGRRNIWVVLLSYIVALSFSAHKEFRFLHPMLPLVCLLVGPRIQSVSNVGSSKYYSFIRRVMLVVFVVANLSAALYLGLIHQSAPISINRKIIEIAKWISMSGASTGKYSVFYWTGACHSTPLHSHLHVPPLKFETWSLDCSPDCLAGTHLPCESARFVADPVAFVSDALCVPAGGSTRECSVEENNGEVCRNVIAESKTCPDHRPPPDFVVTRSAYESSVVGPLQQAGLKEVARFIDSISGVRVDEHIFGQAGYYRQDFRHIRPLSWLQQLASSNKHLVKLADSIEISVEEMILFSRVPLH